jgi:hypothetical protein
VNIVILNWQRPLCEGDQEVVKRSGRDESVRVVIHKCMETTLGVSLYSYPDLKLAKTLLHISLMFLFNKIGEQEGGTGSTQKGAGGRECLCEGRHCMAAQTAYTHVSKCKNDKIKKNSSV